MQGNFSRAVLNLYDLAEQTAPDRFTEQVLLTSLRGLLRFEGALYRGVATSHAPTVLRLRDDGSAEAGESWPDCAALASDHPVMVALRERLARRLPAPREAPMPPAAEQARHLLLCRDPPPAADSDNWLLLYRAAADRFQQSDCILVRDIWPHVVRARRLNLERSLDALLLESRTRPAALINDMGVFEVANEPMRELLALETFDLGARSLPLPVVVALLNTGVYRGRRIEIRAEQKYGYIACTARRIAVIDTLAPSERAVAERYAKGMKREEIARGLKVSPHTVRNQLANVYEKLGVHSKAELARLLLGRSH